ncbi:tyrosine-type recombinase/integrase [uncultured Holdemanella sp.]|uniref:tyrosine-type recombinase/integrase n=1 Tax=uncultured Holdemanella sp. TaxID=1763549 RepID=UPI0025D660C1|nr:tyrosine-type recombinase/integrase [uncultured Holdemanella sp.]
MNNDFSYYLRKFLSEYLPREKGFNSNTIDSYRYSFILLLNYLKDVGIKAEKVKIIDLTNDRIIDFLNYLENNRKNSISTRNSRLAAIHSFFKYLQYEYPDYIDEYTKILNIPFKKVKTKQMSYLTVEEMIKLIGVIDKSSEYGYRDYMIILLMYESAIRVSELINVRLIDFRFSKPYSIKIVGKGNKQRYVPLSEQFIEKVQEYVLSLNNKKLETDFLFTNHSNNKLTRAGVSHILNKYVTVARKNNPSLFKENVTPHTLRHTKAMHLLQDDVNLIYIRDILGHSSIQTTEIYARADSARLRQAIEKSYKELSTETKCEWQEEKIINWLKSF